MKTKILIAALLLCLLSAAGLPHTSAYMVARTPAVVNTFTADGMQTVKAPICLSLRVENGTPESFPFALENLTTGQTLSALTDENGMACFPFEWSALDEGTHRFRLYQITGSRPDLIYDETVFLIEVTVTVQGGLRVQLTVNGQPVSQIICPFVNRGYRVPPTGDETPAALCAALMALSLLGMALTLRKPRRAS